MGDKLDRTLCRIDMIESSDEDEDEYSDQPLENSDEEMEDIVSPLKEKDENMAISIKDKVIDYTPVKKVLFQLHEVTPDKKMSLKKYRKERSRKDDVDKENQSGM
ncbi:MAG: hypothetical protein IPK55_14740 [Streptococcus sp.]|nr:hypothetical protein [Streptococcus sp.]